MTPNHLISTIISLAISVSISLYAQDAATSTSWTSVDGRAIQAKFVKLDGESVVIDKNGKEITIPFAKLSSASIAQAKKISAASVAKEKKLVAELAAAQAKLSEAAARLSPQQLKSALSKFTVSPTNAKGWRLTFTDASIATVSFSYRTPAQWFPIPGMALRREDQLRAAVAARAIREQGGRGLSDQEVQFLSFETRVLLERHPGQARTFNLNFPSPDSVAISQQLARYRARLAEGNKVPADFGAIGANTFGYNADKTLHLNDMSFSSDEVSILEFLVGRVPVLQQEIYKTLINE
jgi:hypothetical protein